MIAVYPRRSDHFEEAIGGHAIGYANPVEHNYKTLFKSVRSERRNSNLTPSWFATALR